MNLTSPTLGALWHRAQESFGLGQLSQDHRTEDEVFKWVLHIPEVPRGEASSWSPPELQERRYDTWPENIWAERRWSWDPVWIQ